jgi:tRNA threonylcarbamoyl adenosine modification protein YeaZ
MNDRAGATPSTPSTHDGRRPGILAIDTGTTRIVIATGSPDGAPDGLSTWPAGYRHGETLLPAIGRFLGEQNLRRSRLRGIIVGTGPGAFTGLRVGIATAKGLALGLGIPLVGVSTAEALISSAAAALGRSAADLVLLQPAGPSDRVLTRAGQAPILLRGEGDPDLAPQELLVAVDLDARAPDDALARGEVAHAGLGAALLALGAPRLSSATREDLADLVPEYVTLPRGATPSEGAVTWSHDLR